MLQHAHSASTSGVHTTGPQIGSEFSLPLLATPEAVLADPALGNDEKRRILASWLSDARAVIDAPAWRELDDGSFVRYDDVLVALKQLDSAGAVHGQQSNIGWSSTFSRRRTPNRWFRNVAAFKRRDDDDDDPPPCPVASRLPPGGPPPPVGEYATLLMQVAA
jgi:hypothetical protein